MNLNIHQPERHPDETFADYKTRRQASHAATAKLALRGLSGKRTSRELLRDEKRNNGSMKRMAGYYRDGLTTWITRANLNRIEARKAAKARAVEGGTRVWRVA